MENQGQAGGNQEQAGNRFTRRLTQGEVHYQMILFPFVAVAACFEFQPNVLSFMDVKDSLEKEWSFLVRFHAHAEFGNYMSVSWPQFSMEKQLKANDEVTFIEIPHREGEEPTKKFKVQIKRKIRLFGQDIWGELNV
ncbi:hypothetical protein V6N13_004800 [Hibiscus sabdariffa]|uniref:TF-B3 domain-containing protein n=1 Tax=Hibiscus sabdariffa TaxID=183260 RepID=A0ABR2S063_9ROSI